MPLEPLWKGSELLHKLLSDYLSGRIGTGIFCNNFETAFNFDTDHDALTPTEFAAFRHLFDQVIWYCSIPEEQATIPGYKREEEIFQAAREAEAQLHGAA